MFVNVRLLIGLPICQFGSLKTMPQPLSTRLVQKFGQACGLSLCLGLLLTLVGCQSLGSLSPKKLPFGQNEPKKDPKSRYQPPTRMVMLWSPAMYTQAGSNATRGFGGRVYFYNGKDEAVPVDGKLVVYAFDDSNGASSRTAPDKTFVFTSKQFTEHFSPTQLGASYSIWIPWDAMGGTQADISLLPIFTTAGGQVLTGQQSKQLLPGKPSDVPVMKMETHAGAPVQVTDMRSVYTPIGGANISGASAAAGNFGVAQVGYQEPVNPLGRVGQQHFANGTGADLQTLSISLPAVTAERLANSTVVNQRPAMATYSINNLPANAMPENLHSGTNGTPTQWLQNRVLGSPLGAKPAAGPTPTSPAVNAPTSLAPAAFTAPPVSLGVGPAVPRQLAAPRLLQARSGPPTPPAQALPPLPPVGDQLPTQLYPAAQP